MPLTPYTRPADGQVRLLTKVARMYHERGVRQADIAAALNISQAKVSRLLKRAESVGIVRTIVTVAPGVYAELEEQLEEKYGLAEAVVVDVDPDADEGELLASLGAGAAAYLEATLSGSDRIGVSSWSQTILAMVDRMRPFTVRGATEVVQLLGGVGAPEAQSHSNRILGELARTLGRRAGLRAGAGHRRQTRRSATACCGSVDAGGRAALERAHHGDHGHRQHRAVRRAGRPAATRSPPRSAATSSTRAPSATSATASSAPTARSCAARVDDRIIAITVENLRRIPRRVGIAGGERKLEAIHGALAGDWVTRS